MNDLCSRWDACTGGNGHGSGDTGKRDMGLPLKSGRDSWRNGHCVSPERLWNFQAEKEERGTQVPYAACPKAQRPDKPWIFGEASVMLENNIPEGGGNSRDGIGRQGPITKDLSVTLKVELSSLAMGAARGECL